MGTAISPTGVPVAQQYNDPNVDQSLAAKRRRRPGETDEQYNIRQGRSANGTAIAGGDSYDRSNSGLKGTLRDAGDILLGKSRYKAQAGTINVNPEDQQRQLEVRSQQQGYNAWLQNAMAGNGPSVAELQLRQGQNRAAAMAAGNAASARGNNVALAQRTQGQALATNLQAANQQAAQLRASEQQAYAQQYGQQLTQQRLADLHARGMSIDEARATLEAEEHAQTLNQQTAVANAKNASTGAGAILSAAGALALSDIRAKEDVQELTPQSLEEEHKRREADMQRATDNYKRSQETQTSQSSGGGGGFLSTLGSGLMSSDFTSKEDLAPVRPVNYSYTPETSLRMALERGKTPEQRRMVYEDKRQPRNGIIAQDLEKSPAFKDTVVDTPAGKAVAKDRALSEALSQVAMLDKRLKRVESKRA